MATKRKTRVVRKTATASRALEMGTAGGGAVLVELAHDAEIVAVARVGGVVAGGGPDKYVRQLGDVGETIADVCRTVQEKVRQGLQQAKPQELTLEFGVKLAGEAGVPLVTKGTAEAAFQVSVKWDFR